MNLVEEKPVAAGYGILVYVKLAEPMLFLQGFDHQDATSRRTVMLRGSLVVRVTKTAKIKAITLNFKGKARTEWPEGIPPRQCEYFEEEIINRHTWPFFNAQFPAAERGYSADYVRLAQGPDLTGTGSETSLSGRPTLDSSGRPRSSSSRCMSTKEQKRLSLQLAHLKGLSKSEGGNNNGPSVGHKGYRAFYPGDYIYNFELPLDSRLPETIDVELGRVKYELEASVERAGAFRANVGGSKEVTLVRAPGENSLEHVEPIAINRTWEDQLHYDIVISGKSFPLGAQVPIAFKLTPLAKVQCHLIRIYLTETIEYFCSNKTVHRLEPTRKVLLLEKRADGLSVSTFPGSSVRFLSGGGVDQDAREASSRGVEPVGHGNTSLLGNLNGEHNVGPTELEFNVQLPNCQSWYDPEKSPRIHFDTTFSNIQVHHWIKIVMRLSKPGQPNSNKRRHFEISIDSPLHILSCQVTQANITLPAYTSVSGNASAPGATGSSSCRCFSSTRQPRSDGITTQVSVPDGNIQSNQHGSLASLPAARTIAQNNNDVPRPIHFLRNPSFNPPAFDAEMPPPRLLSPPPEYDSIVGASEGLADYFSRLAHAQGDEDDEEADRAGGGTGPLSPGRVNIPLTPGGRVNRSMDEPRTWVAPGHGL
ncbi:MAG: hypothetical protein M1816_004769 [Peltula sp. TS41687]|nr:MAG: hypothetical protein M1816_004769 [Peltula sp. TS41687]